MPNVFVSYASADHDLVANEFVGLLQAVGFNAWFAPKSIRSGENWEKTIRSGLEAADWLVVVVTRRAARSKWVKREVAWGFEHLRGRIVPILVDGADASAVDARLARVQQIHYEPERSKTIHRLVEHFVTAAYGGLARDLTGAWTAAYQPVHYPVKRGWHVQSVQFTRTNDGYTIDTLPSKRALQWRWDAQLVANNFLFGRWYSKRKGSTSHGVMCVQISRNGLYMCGHDYGATTVGERANFGVLLFAQGRDGLKRAWTAMDTGRRKSAPLEQRVSAADLLRLDG